MAPTGEKGGKGQNKQQGNSGRGKGMGNNVQIRWVFEDLVKNSKEEPA